MLAKATVYTSERFINSSRKDLLKAYQSLQSIFFSGLKRSLCISTLTLPRTPPPTRLCYSFLSFHHAWWLTTLLTTELFHSPQQLSVLTNGSQCLRVSRAGHSRSLRQVDNDQVVSTVIKWQVGHVIRSHQQVNWVGIKMLSEVCKRKRWRLHARQLSNWHRRHHRLQRTLNALHFNVQTIRNTQPRSAGSHQISSNKLQVIYIAAERLKIFISINCAIKNINRK